MSTYPVRLTKASDNAVHHEFLLAEGRDGQPRVRLGSREKEAAKAGQRGVIVINSLHHGSGQHIARDPMMYEFADGMFVDEPGLAKTRGAFATIGTLGTAEPHHFLARAAISAESSNVASDDKIVITPTQVYDNGAAALAPLASNYFSGSYAQFGRYKFLGQHEATSGVVSSYAGRHDVISNNYSNNANFVASFLAGQGDKMWRVENNGTADTVDIAWTDDINATPVFSTPFSAARRPGERPQAAGLVGPHLVVALNDSYEAKARLIAVDSSGLFTPLADNLPLVWDMTPFLGGQIVWLSGRTHAIWMPAVTDFRQIELMPVDSARGQLGLLSIRPRVAQPVGLGVAATGRELFVGLYGSLTKRDGSTVNGSVLVQALLDTDGLHSHVVATPESVNALENAHIAAISIAPAVDATGANSGYARGRRVHLVTTAPEANASNSTQKWHRLDIWDGALEPNTPDAGTKFLRTSRYIGDHWTTKQGELLRGYITQLPTNSNATVRVYLDGDTNETCNFVVKSTGPFAQSLPTNVVGRDVALDIETAANGAVVVEFPWSLDYFAVPDQKDIVRLPVLAGRDQITGAGTLSDKTRAETLNALAGICASPERWTLKWWDATPDWDVVPLTYETIETEPAHVEGAGAAVAWLTLQRL